MPGADVRLYQEVPAGLTARANQGQGTGAKRKEPKPSRFEQVASAAEEFQAIGEQLSRSRVKVDKQLSSKVRSRLRQPLTSRKPPAIASAQRVWDQGLGIYHDRTYCLMQSNTKLLSSVM